MSHYENFELNGIEEVKEYFGKSHENVDENNFCLFSTSGVHGTYNTLEDVERFYSHGGEEEGHPYITILIVRPRMVSMIYGDMVSMIYGDIEIESCDIPYLKKLRELSWEVVSKIGMDYETV